MFDWNAQLAFMRRGDSAGMEFIKQTLQADYLEHRLEAVIILGEIPTDSSQSLLTGVLLDREQHPEIRAGAAWALGELKRPASVDALVQTFSISPNPFASKQHAHCGKLRRQQKPMSSGGCQGLRTIKGRELLGR